MRPAKARDLLVGGAVLAAGIVGGLAWDQRDDEADRAEAKVEIAQPLGVQVRDACARDRVSVELEFGISCERGAAVVEGHTDPDEVDDPDPNDPDPVDDPDPNDPEVQDPEVDDPDPDDPETQESEIQDFEVQDPQDPPTVLRLYEEDGVTVFRVCTLLPGPDAEVRDYLCDIP